MPKIKNAAAPGSPDDLVEPKSVDSLEPFLNAVNDASNRARNMWLGFIGLLAYLFVAIAGVEHKDLLLDSSVKLPIVNVDIPLFAFFLFGPFLLVFIHFGLLMQHVSLSRTLREFNKLINEFVVEGVDGARAYEAADHPIRQRLHSYSISQYVCGPRTGRIITLGHWLMGWLTINLLPIAILIFFQVQFLAYHSEGVTWMHRLAIFLDLAALIFVGSFIDRPSDKYSELLRYNWKERKIRSIIIVFGALLVLFISLGIATVPNERLDKIFGNTGFLATDADWRVDKYEGRFEEVQLPRSGRKVFWPTACFFEQHPSCWRFIRWFRRNLIVTDIDFVANGNWKPGEVSVTLRNRNLDYAWFDRSDLRGVDLEHASLRNTWLIEAILDHGRLNRANMEGAILWKTSAKEADLHVVDLKGAVLHRAKLQRADLRGARLQGADLSRASLQGARLWAARLQGATLDAADLRGALLVSANLIGASLRNALLLGADLPLTKLHAANLQGADLRGADMKNSVVWLTIPPPEDRLDAVYPRVQILQAPNYTILSELESLLPKFSDSNVRNRVERRLANILHSQNTADYWSSLRHNNFWRRVIKEASSEHDISSHVEFLFRMACDDGSETFVSRGISQRMEPYDLGNELGTRDYSAKLAARFLNAKHPHSNCDCPGINNIEHEGTWSELRAISYKYPTPTVKSCNRQDVKDEQQVLRAISE